jgi:hypothetical protein
MDAAAPSPAAVVGERVAVKLNDYFELAKEEIDRAVRAEEWASPTTPPRTTAAHTASCSKPRPPASPTPSRPGASLHFRIAARAADRSVGGCASCLQ